MCEKTCSRCRETKPTSEFYKDKGCKDGFGSRCKTCVKECATESQKNNREMSWDNYGRCVEGDCANYWHIDHIIPLNTGETKEELGLNNLGIAVKETQRVLTVG